MKDYNILIDCGHGGINSDGVYTTKPNKMYKFNKDTIAYEGKINREIGKRVYDFLHELGYNPYYTVSPTDATDIPLKDRVSFINSFDPLITIGVSFHSNSSPNHNARGFELYTSKGETRSDIIATYIGEEIINEFPDNRFRTDFSDGDLDKESQFYILRKTLCPMVLLENLFFDNINDYNLLKSESFQKRLAWRITNGIVRYLKTIR